MNKRIVVRQTEVYIMHTLSGEGTGHDYWHSWRVRNLAEYIGKREGADLFIVRLAALLHDIADWKFNKGSLSRGPRMADRFLKRLRVPAEIRSRVSEIIALVSFKGAGVPDQPLSLEGRIVQDADRLDALGAIGIARTFAYGGSRGREIYNPAIKPRLHGSFTAYRKSDGPTINHFYEKLLLLKSRMRTRTGRTLALLRHRYMVEYLEQFHKEWRFPKKP